MKRSQNSFLRSVSPILGLVLAMQLVLPAQSLANPLDLATIPLANSPTVTIQPNLLFVLDDSGSMAWNYMPDWANKDPAGNTDDTLFRNASYNTIAYNPAIRYSPPAFFDAGGLNSTQYPSQIGTTLATGANTSSALPNWKKVKSDAYLSNTTVDLTSNARYYTIVPGEYCTKLDLKVCITQSAPSAAYPYPAPLRWCDTAANATAATPAANKCQATRVQTGTTFNNLRAPAQYSSSITINSTNISSTNTAAVTGILVSGKQIMAASTGSQSSTANIATNIATQINACTNNITGSCTVAGYSATVSGSKVTILAPTAITVTASAPTFTGTALTFTTTAFAGGTVPGAKLFTPIIPSVTSYPYPGSAVKADARTDCTGTTCTYSEEMTNYANWSAYYQTRIQTMKTAASLAFKDISTDFRVGFMTIWATNSSKALKFDTFNTPQKAAWYSKFFSISPSGATPTRSALSKAGRIYANKETIGGVFSDPMEYSCQQNFALMTTDGFWNTDAVADIKDVTGAQIGDRDASPIKPPMYEGGTASSNTLADVAKYYRDTDLRTTALGNCTGALGGNVCQEPAPSTSFQKQTMVTMTLGLGVDGTLSYTSDYKTATSGDYADIKAGTKNWPVPAADQPTAVDDLWHAAVNGEGTYFSAKDPSILTSSLKEALATVKVKVGAASAAATSTLNPTKTDHFAYVASYTTGQWTGNLEQRNIDVVTGAVGATALACVEDVVTSTSCTVPSSIVADGAGGYNCVTPNSTPSTCSGTLVGTDCKVSVPVACSGTLKTKISDLSDTRVIKMKSGGGLVDFTYGNLSTAQQTTFNSTFLAANLTQWPSLTSAQIAHANGSNLVNYLRGQTGFDENAASSNNKIFRKRQAVMGDVVDSTPAFIGAPTFSYTDPGYDSFKTAQSSRPKTVYIGSNDGMLHAFNADTMQERWAYVPSMVIPNMWKLADTAYSTKHSYYADGSPIISDICVSGCGGLSASWKTILVAGLNGGGRGYYALDITDPTTPLLLWEFDANNEQNLGYTFGSPVITKKPDGTWVVLVTSGYNNIPDDSAYYALTSTKFKPNNPALYKTGNGQGYLFVLDAASGNKIAEITTGVGSTGTPSGLAKINAYAEFAEKNNTSTYVYGGDLLGNLWRFNISNNTVFKLAQLQAGGITQPITVAPEISKVNNKVFIYVGTGKYLEVSDLTNTDQQSFYAIKDDNATATLVNPRSVVSGQQIVPSGADSRSSGSSLGGDATLGWYVDFPDAGERQNVATQLVLGTLLVPTTVPTSSACQPAGYGWFNFLDYKTGRAVVTTPASDVVSKRTSAPVVGFNVVYINGVPKVSTVTADDPNPHLLTDPPFNNADVKFHGRRSIWRELTN